MTPEDIRSTAPSKTTESPVDQTKSYGGPSTLAGAPGDELPRFGPAAVEGELGKLGRYRVQKLLGQGGMGAVFLAYDERLRRKIALKVMLPKAAANAEAKGRFLREARSAAQINSEYVVSTYDADEIDGIPFIALQYLEGSSLDVFMANKGALRAAQVIRIGREIALGLAAAHQLGMVHRDIKPSNLWLEAPAGRIKILDFGLAKPIDGNVSVELTGTGMMVGTPAYMAPEQARAERVDHRTDLYSLGAVLYRLCTSELPVKGTTTMAMLTSLAVDAPKPVRHLNADIPEALAELIHQMLAKEPEQRPASAQEVAERLTKATASPALASMPLVATPVPVTAPTPMPMPAPNRVDKPNPFADLPAPPLRWPAMVPEKPKPSRADALACDPGTQGKRRFFIGLLITIVLLGLLAGLIVATHFILRNRESGDQERARVDNIGGRQTKAIAQVSHRTAWRMPRGGV